MRLKDKIDIGYRIIVSRLLSRKAPLAVAWSVTNECNLNCKYCGRRKIESKELETRQMLLLIDGLKDAGTKALSFTGGEPLLRDDIGQLVNYAHKKGIYVNINTNGTLFSEKISEFNSLDSVRFSLDGPRQVNDYLRGRGTFQKVVQAIDAAKSKGVFVSIVTVLSKHNLSSVDYLIGMADDLEIGVLFQPLTKTLLGTNIINPHIPDVQEYKKTIDKLIEHRKKSNVIINSVKGLIYLRSWPEGRKIFCRSRNISCRVETNGYLYHCGRRQDKDMSLNCLAMGVKKAFDDLPPVFCNDCWCALRLETNLIASLDFKVIFSVLKDGKWLGRLHEV